MAQPKSIQEILDGLLKSLGLETRVKERMAVVVWSEVVGKRVAEVTRPERVMDGILFVKVDSSTWRTELLLHRDRILKKLNKKIGKPVIAEIRFI